MVDIDIYFSYRYPFTVFASMIGYKIGTRADAMRENRTEKTFSHGVDIDFIDNNFKKRNFSQLLKAVNKYDPELVIVPDVFEREQLDETIDFSEKLIEKSIKPIIVPKCNFDVECLPNECILGYSVKSGYGKTNANKNMFKNKKVHLLGGNIENQISVYELLSNDFDSEIVSIDTNYFCNSSQYGHIVNSTDSILSGGNFSENDVDWLESWESRILVSLVRYYEFWQKKTVESEHSSTSVFDY